MIDVLPQEHDFTKSPFSIQFGTVRSSALGKLTGDGQTSEQHIKHEINAALRIALVVNLRAAPIYVDLLFCMDRRAKMVFLHECT